MEAPSLLPYPIDHEEHRLRTLEAYDVLDAPPSEAFDRITRLATRLFDVPIALVNFIDRKHQWCLSACGLALEQTSREVSFCTHAIESDGVMVVEDASNDPRFVDNPLVTGEPHIRFYAGAPLVAPNGYRLGTLCLIDSELRSFSAKDRRALADLAGVIMDELNLRHYAFDLDVSREAYRASSEHTTRILESITDAFFALDDAWRLTYVNAQAEELLERSRNELVGKNVWDEFPEAVGSTFHKKFRRAVRNDVTVEFVEFFPPLKRWFEVKAFPFRGGLSVYFDDVTDRVEAKENLRRERDLTEAIMDASVAAILTVDTSGAITFANDRASEVLGIERSDLVGHRVSEWTPTDFDGTPLSDEERPLERILRTGEPIYDARYTVRIGDRSPRVLSANAAPLRDQSGSVRQIVYSIVDLTDQVQRARELEAAKEEAERASRLKSSFLANMSHDVRTPLSSIMNLTELLALEVPEKFQGRLDLIERSSKRLLNTIDSVLALSKLESGSLTLDRQPLDVADELMGTVEIFQPQATERDITLEADFAGEPIPAELDPSCLHRITDNLIGNALKFTEPGSTIRVRAQADEETVHIAVADTGPGIDADFLPDLFEAFVRGSTPTKKEGSGLGLAITKRLTELMGGTIDVESEKGVGTTFTVHLPRHGSSAEHHPQPPRR